MGKTRRFSSYKNINFIFRTGTKAKLGYFFPNFGSFFFERSFCRMFFSISRVAGKMFSNSSVCVLFNLFFVYENVYLWQFEVIWID